MSIFKRSAMVVVGVLSMLLVGTAAHAVLTARSGGAVDVHRFVHQDVATNTTSTVFTDVPSATTSVTIPSGQSRLFNARFSAESQCSGTSGGYCSVRIVVVLPSGAIVELNPSSGTDFAFDSAGSTVDWESHAMERTSTRYGAGTYRIKVQATRVGTATSLRLDDWTLAVASIR
ncbi:MAG TPA: hypothetical protein VFO77_03225 [Actinoplanes sp.]|nr:hypothetical protein [Actinoplanes sp.]